MLSYFHCIQRTYLKSRIGAVSNVFWAPLQHHLALPFAAATSKGIAFTRNLQTKTGGMSPKAKHRLGACPMLTGRYLGNCPTPTLRSDPAINFVGISLKRWRKHNNKSFPFPFLTARSQTHFINFLDISYGCSTIYVVVNYTVYLRTDISLFLFSFLEPYSYLLIFFPKKSTGNESLCFMLSLRKLRLRQYSIWDGLARMD